MAAKSSKAKPLTPEEEAPATAADAPLTLSAEERRRRVEAVRSLDGELRTIESALLDAQARIPKLIGEVAHTRRVIKDNTTT